MSRLNGPKDEKPRAATDKPGYPFRVFTLAQLSRLYAAQRFLLEWLDTTTEPGLNPLNPPSRSAGLVLSMLISGLAMDIELEPELGRERRAAAKASRKARNLPIGRPRARTADKIELAERMRVAGEPMPVIEHLGVSRPTLNRSLAEWANGSRQRSPNSARSEYSLALCRADRI